MSTHLSSKLDSMIALIEEYEKNSKKLQIDRLIELHSDLFESYRLLASQEDQAKAIDGSLFHYLGQSAEGEVSTLRSTMLQLHATWFYFSAGAPLSLSDAFDKARDMRGDTPDEGPYFRRVLVPRMIDGINTILPPRVRLEVLAIIAKLENEADVEPIVGNEHSDADIQQIPRAEFILGLVRRWEAEGRQNLAEQPNTLENRLFRGKRLEQMAKEDPVLRGLLGPRQMGYVSPPPIWVRIWNLLLRMRGWLWALFVDLPGVISRPVFYVLIGVAWIAAAVSFGYWVGQDNERMLLELEQLKQASMTSEPEPEPEPQPPPPPPPEKPDPEEIAREIATLLGEDGIEFQAGSAEISAGGRTILNIVGRLIKQPKYGGVAIEVQGHTDNVGNPQANLDLSRQRAEAVVQYLVSQAGVAAGRLTARGYGDTDPQFDNETSEGRRKNRRIEFRVSGA